MLHAPAGSGTRPTADRVRQAVFDTLLHAPWAPWGGTLDGVRVLDAFAGTGALGLEALSRGATHASFFESDRAAFAVLQGNVRACGAGERSSLFAADVTRPPPSPRPCDLLFLDPPYGRGLVPAALASLRRAGWLAPGAIAVAETAPGDTVPTDAESVLFDRAHGAARVRAWALSPG